MKKRDRRLITPYHASKMVGKSDKQSTLFDEDFICDAVPESTEVKPDTSSAFYLKGEGTSTKKEDDKDEEKSKSESKSGSIDKHNEIISNTSIKTYSSNQSKQKHQSNPNPKNIVSVFGPDRKKLKNTKLSKAKKWIKDKKARQVKDKSIPGAFAIQLLQQPIGKIRVPVVNPDGSPAMPTLSSRARRWIKEGKAIPKRTKPISSMFNWSKNHLEEINNL